MGHEIDRSPSRVNVRLTSYEDPGWYQNPAGTAAYRVE
jgi:hypothetical protein